MKAQSECRLPLLNLLAEFDAARGRLRDAWERFEAAGPEPEDVDLALADVRAAELAVTSALMRAKKAGLKAWPDAVQQKCKRGRFARFLRFFRPGFPVCSGPEANRRESFRFRPIQIFRSKA